MFRLILDDPLLSGIPGPELTGSLDLTDITFAGQRPFPADITAGGKSHWLTPERNTPMIYCGIHEADETPEEFVQCLKNTEPPPAEDDE